MLKYTLVRTLIFAACVGVLWLLGLREREQLFLLFVIAALASMVISIFALKGMRREYSAALAQKIDRRRAARHQGDVERVRTADELEEDAEAEQARVDAPPAEATDATARPAPADPDDFR